MKVRALIADFHRNISWKFYNYVCGVLYVYIYNMIYRDYTVPVWKYMANLVYNDLSIENSILLYLGAALPLLFYKGLNTVASIFSLCTYLFIIVPMCVTSLVVDAPFEFKYTSFFLLIICSITFFKTDKLVLMNGIFKKLNSYNWNIKVVVNITLICFAVLVLLNIGNMKFVNFFENSSLMYELRAENSSSRFMLEGYLLCWVKFALLPLLLSYYCSIHDKKRIILVMCAYIIIFMIDMQKITFLIPFVIVLISGGMQMNLRKLTMKMHRIITLVIISTSALLTYFYEQISIFRSLVSIFVMRTLCVEGWLYNIYIDFFSKNDYTYFSHINIVNFITKSYPFGNTPLGNAVTDGGMNANACFMITDGFASLGLWGFIVASILFIIFKSIMNSLSAKYSPIFVFCVCLYAISAFLNVSLMTAIFSDGFVLIYIFLAATNFGTMKNGLPTK